MTENSKIAGLSSQELLDRWENWTGTAAELVATLEDILPGDDFSKGNLNKYVSRRVISPSSGRGGYTRRHILEAIAARSLKKDGWKISKIAEVLPSYTDRQLAEISASAPIHVTADAIPENHSDATENPRFANSAMLLVQKFRAGDTTPDNNRQSATRSLLPFAQNPIKAAAYLAIAPDQPAVSVSAMQPQAVDPKETLTLRGQFIDLSIDKNVLNFADEIRIREEASTLINAAIAHLADQQKRK